MFAGAKLVPGPVLTIENGRITAVGFGVPAQPGATDLGDVTLLPGLVDAHTQPAFDASTDPVGALGARDEDETLEAMRAAARTAVRGGVTTVRDLGDRGYLALRLRDERGPVPTILAAGPPSTVPGGHCHYLGGETEPTADALRAAVRERSHRGVDLIKIMASGGTLTPGTRQENPQFEVPQLRAAVDEAHRLGLTVTAHVHATQAIRNVVEAGVDSMEHVSLWTAEGVDHPDPELVHMIVDRRTVVSVASGTIPLAGFVPPPDVAARIPGIARTMLLSHRSGARLVLSSDAGINAAKPHDVLRYTIIEAIQAGLAPAEALRLATEAGADACAGSATGKASWRPVSTPTCSLWTVIRSRSPRPSTGFARSTAAASWSAGKAETHDLGSGDRPPPAEPPRTAGGSRPSRYARGRLGRRPPRPGGSPRRERRAAGERVTVSRWPAGRRARRDGRRSPLAIRSPNRRASLP